MSRETKLGFAFVFVLCVVFGFVVYKKIERNRADRGDLLAGVQSEGQEAKTQEAPVEPKNSAQNPFAENTLPPAQPGDPFPEPTPAQMSPASWNNQSFAPVPEPQTAGTSIDPFPTAAPVEQGSKNPPSDPMPFPAQQEPQTNVATTSQPIAQPEEFSPTPVPEPEVAQTPVPQGFEPPQEFGNPAQASTRQPTPAEPADPNFNPFGSAGTTVQAQPQPTPADIEDEQFSTQSQIQPQEVVQQQPVPVQGNPFGERAPSQNAQPVPQELPTAQAAPESVTGDPFSTPPPVYTSAQSMPMPAEVAVENDPRFGDFQPAPMANQYEPEPRSVPNELPSDVFAQMSSRQIAADAAAGYGQMQPTDQPQVYVVRPGDNYWNISKRQYGTVRYFMALARYNQQRIPDPKRMQPGMKVLTPTRDVLESRNPDLFPRFAANSANVHNVAHEGGEKAGFFVDASGTAMYRVGPDDTLGGIAQKHLGRFSRWVEIYQMNRHRLKDPNALSLGDILQLPPDASRVSMVQHASGIR